MKLFLASEAKHPKTMKDIEAFIDGWDNKKLAYVVTAANGEKWGSWQGGGSIKAVCGTNSHVNIIQFELGNWDKDLEIINTADILWLAGGMTGYLLKNGEAVTVVDGKVKVLGEKRVISK